ncbi:amino acid/polyamine transporter I [Neohortaea acidophila]|uniref:Amino acid/polyamine transporter I n=1 Tax=Neohortaea acidophila TaxID=245834 RepID=A0A6A6PWN2_9PEZI|nr:amino acid/polyamine transporter I [Neohortaea acidophila]KAF2484089.1 amino acid/polyamine transporter I [Neohortaea acidophila]
MSADTKVNEASPPAITEHVSDSEAQSGDIINASGHVQELRRQFSLLSLAGVGLVVGDVWPALGGSILVALYNGGPPGVLYEFIVVSIFYWIVAASIAELASAIPSSAGVYHWASITPGPKWGRVVGFFAGYWNWLAWVWGEASFTLIFANTIVQMYALNHPGFQVQPWQVFVTYVIATWSACAIVCTCNRAMPYLNQVGIFFVLGGYLITVVVVAVMPGRNGRPPHATSSFVWTEWRGSGLGYPSGFVFVAGMLNGAFSVGTPDATTHLAEEVPYPQRNVPIAIGLQMAIGFLTGFTYLIAIFYAIHDFDALFGSPYPIAEIYRQATGSAAGATGLLALVLICIGIAIVGLYITCGRTLWALSRDGATPFPKFLSRVSPRFDMPLNATVVNAIIVTALGAIYVGSTTAFNAFVGSYIVMSSSSYIAAILPNLLTGRKNIEVYGPFHLQGALGFLMNGIACSYMIVWFVIYCFPYSLPTDAQTFNYACVLWCGFTIFIAAWWFIGARKDYRGPPIVRRGGRVVVADTVKAIQAETR